MVVIWIALALVALCFMAMQAVIWIGLAPMRR